MLRKALVALLLLLGALSQASAACGDGASTCWWVGGGSSANWNATGNTNWGSASNTRDNVGPPATGDDLCFDGSVNGNTNSTLNTAFSPKSIDFTGCGGGGGNYTATLTHNTSVNLTVGTAGKTGGVAKWNSSMGYTLGNAASSALIFDADGGTNVFTSGSKTFGNITIGNSNGGLTVQLSGSLTIGSGATFTLTRGTFDTQNNNMSVGIFSSSNTNTRTLTLGSSTVTVTGTASSVVNFLTITNLTFTANTSTIDLNATATAVRNPIFSGSGWNNISVTNASVDGKPISLSGSASMTAATLTLTNVSSLQLNQNTTTTLTTLNYTGTSSNPAMIFASGATGGSIGTLALTNTWSPQYMAFNGIARSAGTITATNSWNAGNNTTGANFTITAPAAGGGGRCIGC